MTRPPPDIPRQIARFAAECAGDANRLPPPVADLCRAMMLNAAAAALAGAAQPDAIALTRVVREMGGNGRSTIIGMGQRTSPVYAALVNGTLIRLLDFDDHAVAAGIHPTAAVMPAVLALGEMHGSPGPAALSAFAVGCELVARLSTDSNLAGSAGTMGAAAASAMLLGLDDAAAANAVALAAGSADSGADSGIGYAAAGAAALPSGRAAMLGVMTALQASAGISAGRAAGPPSDTTASDGLALNGLALNGLALNGLALDGLALDGLGARWHLADPGVAIRLYPCHPAAHTIIDAALGLVQLHRFAPDDILSVEVGIAAAALEQLPYALPADGWQARACAGFIAAATLCHGPPLINFFSDMAVRDDGVRAMLERVSVAPALSSSPLSLYPAEVSVTLHDGRILRHRADHARGSPQLPPDAEELEAKFLYCTRYILPADHIDEAIGSFRGIADIENITGMVSVLGG